MQEQWQELAEAVVSRLFVELEASGRHVHVTAQQAKVLFGHPLTPERPLSQPGQYLAKERVRLIGPKGEFRNVAVLGPERKEGQVEISLTDGRTLGIDPPIRLSGDVAGSPGITLEGERGRVTLSHGVIAAQRHVHLTPEDAVKFGVKNGQTVCILEAMKLMNEIQCEFDCEIEAILVSNEQKVEYGQPLFRVKKL